MATLSFGNEGFGKGKLHLVQLDLCSLVNPFPAAPPCLGKYLPGEKLC